MTINLTCFSNIKDYILAIIDVVYQIVFLSFRLLLFKYIMPIFKKHLFVCTFGQSCKETQAGFVFEELKRRIYEKCDKNDIRVNRAGCLGQCGLGPVIAIYPENTWYKGVQISDCAEITQSIVDDTVVIRLKHDKI